MTTVYMQTGNALFTRRPRTLAKKYLSTNNRLNTRITALSESPRTVYVARHGERADLAIPNWEGNRDDPPLTTTGLQQATLLGLHLKDAGIEHVYSSPFYRAIQTANQAADVLNVPISLENGLHESLLEDMFTGTPAVIPIEEIQREFPRVKDDHHSMCNLKYPELHQDVKNRVFNVFHALSKKHPSGNILFVSHGRPIEYMVEVVSPEEYDPIPRASFCSLTEFISKGDGTWGYGAYMEDSFLKEEKQAKESILARAASWK